MSKEQKAQEISATKYQSKNTQNITVTENGDGVTSVTVSLPSSKRTSRVTSRVTSRRGSIDLGQQVRLLFLWLCQQSATFLGSILLWLLSFVVRKSSYKAYRNQYQ